MAGNVEVVGVNSDGSVSADLYITQGDTLHIILTLQDDGMPIEFTTGYTADLTVQSSRGGIEWLAITTEDTPPTLTFLEETGAIWIAVPATTTAALSPGEGVWALRTIAPAGVTTTQLRGRAIIEPQIAPAPEVTP